MGMVLSIVKFDKLPSGELNADRHQIEKPTFKLFQLITDWVAEYGDTTIVVEVDSGDSEHVGIHDLSNKYYELIDHLLNLRDSISVCGKTAYSGSTFLDQHNGEYKTEAQFETAIKSHINSLISYVRLFQDKYRSQMNDGYRLIMT